MAGVKGKSGGPRKNSGGARPGAGRKPKNKAPKSANAPGADASVTMEPQPRGGALKRSKAAATLAPSSELVDGAKRDPLAFLELVLNDPTAPLKDRIRAAIAAAQYKHMKKGDGGIKDDRLNAAKKAGSGKFGPRKAPTLVVSNR